MGGTVLSFQDFYTNFIDEVFAHTVGLTHSFTPLLQCSLTIKLHY